MTLAQDPPSTRRFTADEVWKMVEVDLLGPDEPYELIDGELCYVSPQGPPHAWVIRNLTTLLVYAYGPDFGVGVQLPIGGIADSIPEPDIAITRAIASMDEPHPRSGETLLIVEVSSSSRRTDERKVAIYARADGPEYWIIDVERRDVTVHTGPRPDGTWGNIARSDVDATLALPGIEGASLPAARIFSREG